MAKMKEGLSLALQRNLEKCGVPEVIYGFKALNGMVSMYVCIAMCLYLYYA